MGLLLDKVEAKAHNVLGRLGDALNTGLICFDIFGTVADL